MPRAPEVPRRQLFARGQGAENRIEIELASGEVIRLRGQGAGAGRRRYR